MRRGAAALVALLAGALPQAQAGSLIVRDAHAAWTVTDDPLSQSNGFLLRHLVDGTAPDERFGHGGQTAFTLGSAGDPPASLRVDAARRIWMVGAGLAGNQPQPVIARFLADGSADPRWGTQGKLQLAPAGVAIRPRDVLPLADGSALVAGEATGLAVPRAVVFHLNADGSIDRGFGGGSGVWQRPGDAEPSSATSLAASDDGLIAMAVSVRGARPGAELWSLSDAGLAVMQRKPAQDAGDGDGDDLRAEWQNAHWELVDASGPTGVVPAALLGNRAAAAAPASAASDPGGGAFNPFDTDAASAPAATPPDDGLPWTAIGLGILVLVGLAGLVGVLMRRGGKPASRR